MNKLFSVCGQEYFFGRHVFGVGTPEGPPTPQTPLPVPPPRQIGYQSTPFWILHPSAYSSRHETELLQSYGAKTETRTPMNTWPTRHPQLACTAPHFFHFFKISLIISCWHSPGAGTSRALNTASDHFLQTVRSARILANLTASWTNFMPMK